ncbi:MAG: alpha/beta hydrolase family protein [Candidatus Poseidoniaceae archaeon]
MFSHRFSAFAFHVFVWLVVATVLVYVSDLWIFIVLLPIILIDLWFALCLGFMLRLPAARNNIDAPEGWIWEYFDIKGYPVRWLHQTIDSDKPLAILIHGWNSRASNMLGRTELYLNAGFNCVLFEMRAHGGNKSVPHWAAMHVCNDLEVVLSLFMERGWLNNGFIVHGHSLGGFVAQRVLRPELETSKKALGMILESPVTSYEYINNQTCDYLRIPKSLQKPMMKRLLGYYNRLNPSVYYVESIDFLRTPNWGLPRCPTLLVQAKHDSTLGEIHAELLINVHSSMDSNFKYHIVENLKHSHEKRNSTRDEFIRQWMNEESLIFA